MKLFLLLLSTLPLLTTSKSCQLKVFQYDEENWKNASFGFIQGLYYNPPQDCSLCKSFSSDVVLMNRGYAAMDLSRNTWKNYDSWLKSNPFQVFGNLVSSSQMFFNYFSAADRIYKNELIMALPQMMISMLSDQSQKQAVRANIDSNIEQIVILMGTIPGASCKSVGVRLGSVIRLMFNVAFDSPAINKFMEIDDN